MEDAFIRVLRLNVRRKLERYLPANLHEAIRVVERIDSIDFKYKQGVQRAWRPTQQTTGQVPMELGFLERSSGRGGAARPAPTGENRKEFRRCYKCGRIGHIRAACPVKDSATYYRQ